MVHITKIDRFARFIIDLNNVMNEFFKKRSYCCFYR
ncbi:hypothetical protein [Listeria booriae]|nr:hypothetical protein [Listeria booriae]